MTRFQVIQKIHPSLMGILEANTAGEAYEATVSAAMNLTGAKFGSIFVLNGNFMQRVFGSDSKLFSITPRKNGDTMRIFRDGGYYLKNYKEVNKFHPEIDNLGIGSDLTISIKKGKMKIGVLSVLSHKNSRFSSEQVELLKSFAEEVTIILKKITEIDDTKRKLESRNLFISLAAHELKTPLTSMMVYTKLLSRKYKGVLSDLINKIWEEEIRLKDMLSDLLDARHSEIDGVKYNMTKIRPDDLVKKSVQSVQNSYPQYRFQLNYLNRESGLISGDESKLQQAITNVLSNAAKYSSVDHPIQIECDTRNKNFYIKVSDKGKGIPASRQAHVFEKFYKVSRESEGMGLGLFLVKKIVDKHKGEISLKSQLNQGTQVLIRLPIILK